MGLQGIEQPLLKTQAKERRDEGGRALHDNTQDKA